MRYLSLFSGIEAASVGWSAIPGWRAVAIADIEKFPNAVTAHHYPDVPNLGDVTKITEEQIAELGLIDLVVFGSPCQDLSVAGKRAGLQGERSGLFFDAIRILGWARKHGGVRFALWENVPGAFSSNKGRDFAVVVGELAGVADVEVPPKGWGNEGALVGPEGLVEWSTLDAQWFGVAQRRRRVFALADFGNWTRRPPILLEPEGLRGNSAPSREAGESAAGTLESRTRGGGFPGTDGAAAAGHVVADSGGAGVASTGDIAHCLNGGGHGKNRLRVGNVRDDVAGTLNAGGHSRNPLDEPLVAHALRADGFDASEDGTGRGTPLVTVNAPPIAFNWQDDRTFHAEEEVTNPLRACQTEAVAIAPPIVFDTTQITSPTNGSKCDPGAPCHSLAKGGHAPAIAFQTSQSGVRLHETHATLDSNNSSRRHNSVLQGMQVRRLTPRECERLQAFKDDYTLIPFGKRGKPAKDGPRYKALGNSMTTHVMRWIGEQIDLALWCEENL